MGNAQSAITPPTREQMRITKPKTNRSSTNLLAKPSLDAFSPRTPPKDPAPVSRVLETEPVITSATGDRRSGQDARQSLKTHLFDTRYDPASDLVADPQPSKNNGFGNFVVGIRGRLPKSVSQKSLPQLPNATVSALTLNHVAGSKMSLLLEQDEHRYGHGHGRLYESTEGRLYTEHAVAPERPANYESLSRRRSMFTPGIATRGQPTDVLRRAPPSDPSPPRSYFDLRPVAEMENHARMAGVVNVEGGQQEMSSSYPRVSTPCELDYSSLHGLKRGTLRITNGCASPAPSVRSMAPLDGTRPKTPLMTRQPQSSEVAEGLSAETASMLARYYVSQLPARSFASTPTPADGLDRHDAPPLPRSRLFIDETVTTSPTGEGDAGHPTNSKAGTVISNGQDRPKPGHSPSSNEINESPTSHILRQYSSECSSLAVTSLAKSDSGYSSHTSLSSFSRGATAELPLDDSPTGKYQGSGGTRHPTRTPPVPSLPKESTRAEPAPMVPPKPVRSYGAQPSAQLTERRPALTTRHSIAVALPTRSNMKTSESSDNIVSHVRFETNARSSSQNRKLQRKKRPTSQPPSRETPITVQGQRELSGQQLPPVPVAVSSRLAQRLRDFPNLEQTFPTLQHMLSREKLRLVQSSSDLTTIASEKIETDDPNPASRPTKPKTRKRRHIPSFGKKRASLKPLVSSPVITPSTSITDFGTVVESLGEGPYDIALPANSTASASPSRRNSLQHPHQMSTASLQARPTIGMDEEAAAGLARERSRDRGKLSRGRSMNRPNSMVESSADGKAHGRSTPRPVSMYVDGPAQPRAEESSVGGRKDLRRENTAPAAPPVPAIPSRTIGTAGASLEDIPRSLKPAQRPSQQSAARPRAQALPRSQSERSLHTLPPHPAGKEMVEPRYGVAVKAPTQAESRASSWEGYQRAWRQRRLSAGQGLKMKNKSGLTPLSEDSLPRNDYSEVMPSNEYQTGLGLKKQVSRQDVGFTTTRPGRGPSEPGRMTGGVGFDHRHGYGYGLDLRDVPVFVES